jgi:hypothetical protein
LGVIRERVRNDPIKTRERGKNIHGKGNGLKGWSDEDEGAGLVSFDAENPERLL